MLYIMYTHVAKRAVNAAPRKIFSIRSEELFEPLLFVDYDWFYAAADWLILLFKFALIFIKNI